MTKVDAVRVPGDPSRRQVVSWGIGLLAWFLLLWSALAWLVSHQRHVGYGTELRHFLPLSLLYAIVCGGIYLGQLHFAHRARVRRAAEASALSGSGIARRKDSGDE